MKSNVIMTRKMGEFDVLQRTSDGYFDGNELLRQWNADVGSKREVSEFLKRKSTVEFCNTINSKENPDREISGADNQQVAYILKSGRNGKSGRTKNETWMHPYLFIDFAMWINSEFKYEVIRFVYDELIKNRHIAGDNYNKLTAQLSKFPDASYPKVAQALNYIAFNKHYKNIRNDATPEQLKELHELEDKLAFSIEMGFISSYEQLLTTMRKMYSDKHPRF